MAATARSIEERARARWASLERQAQRDLGLWIELRTPDFSAPRHLGSFLGAWDRIHAGETVFALGGAPPRHGKSQTVFHGAVRFLKRYPKKRVIYATYGTEFAMHQSRDAREIAARAGLWLAAEQRMGSRFDPAASARYWQTAEGGGFIAVGRGGAITGRGGDIIIVDDPIKDRQEAESPLVRDQTWTWIMSTLYSRREPGASMFLFHQRWNDDDPIARAIEQGGWELHSFPAISDDGHPLWPERYSLDELAETERKMSPYDWWSQYMQSPRPRGKDVFAPSPSRYEQPNRQRVRLVLGVDAANADKEGSDWNAIVLLAITGAGALQEAWVLRVWRFRAETPELADELLTLFRKGVPGEKIPPLKGVPFVIETQGGEGRAVAQTLKRLDPDLPIVEVTTTKNKLLRAQAVATAWNKLRVHVPHQAPWLDEFLRELRRFTGLGGQHDDQVDALAHAWNHAAVASAHVPGQSGGDREMARSQF